MKTITTCHFEIDCKGALKELSITQKAFSVIMGVTEQAVSGWVKNKSFPVYAVEWLKLQIEANTIITCEKQRGKDALKRHQDSVISERNYLDNVEAIADQVWDRAIEQYEDDNGEKATEESELIDIISYYDLDHDAVDQDEWMIYTRFHSAICQHSENQDAYEDMGPLEGDFARITQIVAFYAMLQDVNETLQDKEL
jgi:transcriptional regulator with XRE-family HTH domain